MSMCALRLQHLQPSQMLYSSIDILLTIQKVLYIHIYVRNYTAYNIIIIIILQVATSKVNVINVYCMIHHN